MVPDEHDPLRIHQRPRLERATLVLAFDGWMDGGEVSTGTVNRVLDLVDAEPIADIDPEPFYIYNFPGSMEVAAIFRPEIEIEEGLIKRLDMPTNTFYCHSPGNLALFVGKEPNLRWRTFGESVFRFCREFDIRRLLFVGSFGGSVPHTREPRMHVTCSDPGILPEMEQYGVRRTGYSGPGSFTSYLMTQASSVGLEMTSLVAEIPGYLQGINPLCIEAVTRRLAKMLKLRVDLDSLRATSTTWELEISRAIEQNEELAARVRTLEEEYDNELLEHETGNE